MFDPETLVNNVVGSCIAVLGLFIAAGLIWSRRPLKVAIPLMLVSLVAFALQGALLPAALTATGLDQPDWWKAGITDGTTLNVEAIILMMVAIGYLLPWMTTINTVDYTLEATSIFGFGAAAYTLAVGLYYSQYYVISVNINVLFILLTALAATMFIAAAYWLIRGFFRSRRAVTTRA